MIKARSLILAVTFILFSSIAHSENYYLSPSGSDSDSGLSTGDAWATLQHARDFSPALGAGDTLFIMGGRYTNAQYFHDFGGYIHGEPGNPVVFKAYGDAAAVFTSTGPHPSNRQYFLFDNRNSDHIVMDGYGSIPPYAPLSIKFEGYEDTGSFIDWGSTSLSSPANYTEGITIRGIEFDGSHTSSFTSGGTDEVFSGMRLKHLRYSTIEGNYFHHIHHPTGPIPPGDDTDHHQGAGYGVYLMSCDLTTVEGNRFERINHGAIYLEIVRGVSLPSGHACRYNKIINNVIENHYGGGIFISTSNPGDNIPQHHNLIDGNLITHCGETLLNSKSAIQLGGSNNVVRRNVIYNPVNDGISLEGQVAIGYRNIVKGNLIYNNVVFGSRIPFNVVVKQVGCLECAVEDNLIVNNILLYKSEARFSWVDAMIVADLYHARDEHNWLLTCNLSSTPHETHWGGNAFHHNSIRKDAAGADTNMLVSFGPDASCINNWQYYSLSTLQAVDPTAWTGNRADDPMLTSEDPDGYGLANGWWRPREGSYCIDGGMIVDDHIGAEVESLFPGYGWTGLPFAGNAPDIGAFEFNGENPAPYSSRPTRISPTNE